MPAILVTSILVLMGIDQITKVIAFNTLTAGDMVPVIPDIFYFTYTENTGAAFGILKNQRWIFIVLTMIVVLVALYILLKGKLSKMPLMQWSFVLIIAGGAGNLIDRIFRGYVVDMIYFKPVNFPVFNFADCCVSIGGVLLFIAVLLAPDELLFKKKTIKNASGATNGSQADLTVTTGAIEPTVQAGEGAPITIDETGHESGPVRKDGDFPANNNTNGPD